MNVYKTFQIEAIPNKIIKMNVNVFTNFVCLPFTHYIESSGEFLQEFKHANVIPAHK